MTNKFTKSCAVILTSVLLAIGSGTAEAAGEIELTLSSGTAPRGGSVSLNLNINVSQAIQNVTGVQWDLSYNPSQITSVSVRSGSAASNAHKNASCAEVSAGIYRCLITGFNIDQISSGVLSVATFNLSGSATGLISVELNGLVATDAAATSIPIKGIGGTITVASSQIGNIGGTNNNPITNTPSNTSNRQQTGQLAQVFSAVPNTKGTLVNSVSSESIVSICSFGNNLYPGLNHKDVVELQKFLIGQSLLTSDNISGFFGPVTQLAVQEFQSKNNIVSSGLPETTGFGSVGPKTRAKINSMLDQSLCPSTNSLQARIQVLLELVRSLQTKLQAAILRSGN